MDNATWLLVASLVLLAVSLFILLSSNQSSAPNLKKVVPSMLRFIQHNNDKPNFVAANVLEYAADQLGVSPTDSTFILEVLQETRVITLSANERSITMTRQELQQRVPNFAEREEKIKEMIDSNGSLTVYHILVEEIYACQDEVVRHNLLLDSVVASLIMAEMGKLTPLSALHFKIGLNRKGFSG